jgi:ligand-binding sensor domain-containing protein
MQRAIKSILLLVIPIIGFCQSAELISTDNSNLPENDIWSIEIDSTGTKWIGTATSGLVSFKDGKFTIYNDSTSNFKGSYISPVFADSKGRLWISASKPDALYSFENEKFNEIKNEILKSLGGVITIAEGQNGTIYFGGSSGIVKFENDNWSKIKLPLKNPTVRAIAISENGELAIGHNSGLLVKSNGEFTTYEESKEGLQLSVIRGLKYIDNNKLIIGYGGGFGNGGFSIKEENKWTHYNRENSRIANHMVRDIEVDKDKVYWLATNEGLTYLKDDKVDTVFFRDGRMKNTIMDIAIHKNEIWVATNFGIIQIKK